MPPSFSYAADAIGFNLDAARQCTDALQICSLALDRMDWLPGRFAATCPMSASVVSSCFNAFLTCESHSRLTTVVDSLTIHKKHDGLF